jgi:hypothetical protein
MGPFQSAVMQFFLLSEDFFIPTSG